MQLTVSAVCEMYNNRIEIYVRFAFGSNPLPNISGHRIEKRMINCWSCLRARKKSNCRKAHCKKRQEMAEDMCTCLQSLINFSNCKIRSEQNNLQPTLEPVCKNFFISAWSEDSFGCRRCCCYCCQISGMRISVTKAKCAERITLQSSLATINLSNVNHALSDE